MILLIHHHRHPPIPAHDNRTPRNGTGALLPHEIWRNKATLEEKRDPSAIQLPQLLYLTSHKMGDALHDASYPIQDRGTVVHPGSGSESVTLEIPGQPDPGGEDDPRVFSGSVQPTQS